MAGFSRWSCGAAGKLAAVVSLAHIMCALSLQPASFCCIVCRRFCGSSRREPPGSPPSRLSDSDAVERHQVDIRIAAASPRESESDEIENEGRDDSSGGSSRSPSPPVTSPMRRSSSGGDSPAETKAEVKHELVGQLL